MLPLVASRTQRSSNLPESLAASVAAGPAASFGQEQLRLQQDLKAVADAEDQLAGVAERGERVGQVMPNLIAEDAAGGDVVAVAEAAGEAEDLELGEPAAALRAGD